MIFDHCLAALICLVQNNIDKSVICCGPTTFHDTELWRVNVQLIHVTAQHFNEASLYSNFDVFCLGLDKINIRDF